MNNLMTATQFVKSEILSELRKGNTDVLKSLPPALVMQCGIALQDESGYKEDSGINDQEVAQAMLNRMADNGIKEKLVKQIEEEQKAFAEKVEKLNSL